MKCEDCRYWRSHGYEEAPRGYCLRYPPVHLAADNRPIGAMPAVLDPDAWCVPVMTADAWCGEFVSKVIELLPPVQARS